jgi:L-ascorbate metabolism protein UlaG (beta-lactamase superfamily)
MKPSRHALLFCGVVAGGAFFFGVVSRAQNVQFSEVRRLTNREVAFRFSAPVGTNYRIDVATNFPADTNLPRWSALLTLQSAPVNQYTDSAAPFVSTRFYRAEQLTNAATLTGDHLATTNGDAVIHPIGHASFVMSWNGKMIYNDPTNGATPYASFPRADVILVSHNHGDHYDIPTINAVRAPSGIIVVPQVIYNSTAFASLRPNAIALPYGVSTNVMGMTIEAVPAYNGNHPYTNNNAYVITLGGKRIFTSGDCGDAPEIRAVTNIDVAFLCMNLPFTMNPSSATNVIRAMRPRIVYPYHFKEGSSVYTNAAYFKQLLGMDLGIEVRLRRWY